MEIIIRDKGRITLPLSIRKTLGIKEKDSITMEIKGNEVILRPKCLVRVKDAKGTANIDKVELEDIEEALGR